MRYQDTVPELATKPFLLSGPLYKSFAESALPTLSFGSVAEAAVAAYVLMATEGTNEFATGIASDLKRVTDPALLASGETVYLAPVTDLKAVLVRRVIGEVATGRTAIGGSAESTHWQIPAPVVRAAQHMHYDRQAHEVGTAAPVHYAWVPQAYDVSTAYDDMTAAVTAIAERGALPVRPPEDGQPSRDWDEYLRRAVSEQLVALQS